MREPMTDADLDALIGHAEYGHFEGQDYDAVETLVAEVRRLRDEVAGANENVASWQGIAADLRADRDELEASYYVLLSQCHRLEEERNQLRVKRTAMLDALEAGQALADLDTWSWEDRQGALREWDQRIARVRDVQRRTTVREPTDITGGHMGADRRQP